MRGTHTGRLEFAQYVGIIPAYAGNTVGAGDCCGEPGDHPRVCGEHKWLSAVPSALAGSSPRMRGTHPDGTADHLRRGIIPAYAGNTKRANPFSNKVRDHPRVCGEHTLQEVIDWCEQGSSPRMRGTRELHGRRTVRHGIIPAYAGNTLAPDLRVRVIGDHPRVCGEHQSERIRLHVGQGSSPRMRGTRRTVLLGTRVSGIIPAYAGNTWSNAPDTWSSADHPRVCGEHGMADIGDAFNSGSSPRMRGTLDGKTYSCKKYGIIPAYAGNTRISTSNPHGSRDHPRVCGEH